MLNLTDEEKYIRKRIWKARIQSIPFYLFRILPINQKKIVFTCIEGTTGYTCNPKYIAEELIRRNNENKPPKYELVWLVNDVAKYFPKEIKVVKNTLINRAFQLATARYWIDNSRKQLECRKRYGQIYIQTWHAKLGFKPTGLDRGASFSKIAYLVTKHDSDMVDYWLSNSDWYDGTLKTGSLYEGKTIRCGSPRCDILVQAKNDDAFKSKVKKELCELYHIELNGKENIDDVHFLMYAPTFRGGSQGTDRSIDAGDNFPDYTLLKNSMEKRFGGNWYVMLRLHPQLVSRGIGIDSDTLCLEGNIVNGSIKDDMYELLAGCDAFLTDYSSAAFDAIVMDIPIFLYCNDYKEYENERGQLLWNLRTLPFPLAENDGELSDAILNFDSKGYADSLRRFVANAGMEELGNAAQQLVNFLIRYE